MYTIEHAKRRDLLLHYSFPRDYSITGVSTETARLYKAACVYGMHLQTVLV